MSNNDTSGQDADGEPHECPVAGCDYTGSSKQSARVHFGASHDDEVKTEVYLTELRRLSNELGRSPGENDMANLGEFSKNAYHCHFGSWNEALEEAGLEMCRQSGITKEDLISELHRLRDELGRTPRSMDISNHSDYSIGNYDYHLGGWNNALSEAGFEITQQTLPPKEDLLSEIRRLADKLGHKPFASDMTEHGKYGARSYFRRFGSWGNALEEAGFEARTMGEWILTGKDNPNWRGGAFPYGSGWNEAKKEQVRERDGRECQCCGRPEDEHIELYGRKHSVHHIQKARDFDDPKQRNHPDNLITLCESKECHKRWEKMAPLRPQVVADD